MIGGPHLLTHTKTGREVEVAFEMLASQVEARHGIHPPDSPQPFLAARTIAFLDFNQRLVYARLDGNSMFRFGSD